MFGRPDRGAAHVLPVRRRLQGHRQHVPAPGWPVAADGTLPATTREYGYNADPAFFFAHDFLGYADHGYWLSYYFPLSRLPEFFLRVLVARLVISGRWRNTRLWWPLAAVAVSFAARGGCRRTSR